MQLRGAPLSSCHLHIPQRWGNTSLVQAFDLVSRSIPLSSSETKPTQVSPFSPALSISPVLDCSCLKSILPWPSGVTTPFFCSPLHRNYSRNLSIFSITTSSSPSLSSAHSNEEALPLTHLLSHSGVHLAKVKNSASSPLCSQPTSFLWCWQPVFWLYHLHVCVLSCLTLCHPVACSLPGSSIHGIFQAEIREWVAVFYSRGSSQPRDRTRIFCVSCIGRQLCYRWATWEAHHLHDSDSNSYLQIELLPSNPDLDNLIDVTNLTKIY